MKETKNIFKIYFDNSTYFVISHKYANTCMTNTYIEQTDNIFSIVCDEDLLEQLNTSLIDSTLEVLQISSEELDDVYYFYKNREIGLAEKILLLYKDLTLIIPHTFELLGDLFAIVYYPDMMINNISIISLFDDSSIDSFFSINATTISPLRLDCIAEKLINLSNTNITLYSFDTETFFCVFKPTNNICYCSLILSDEDYFSEDQFLFYRTSDNINWENISTNITEFLDDESIKYYLTYTNIFIDTLFENIYGGEEY